MSQWQGGQFDPGQFDDKQFDTGIFTGGEETLGPPDYLMQQKLALLEQVRREDEEIIPIIVGIIKAGLLE